MAALLNVSDDARNVVALVKELKVLDVQGVQLLEQLFAYRLNDDLLASLVSGKEATIAATLFKVARSTANGQLLGYILRFLSDLTMVCAGLAAQLADDNAASRFEEDPCARFLELAATNPDDSGIVRPAIFMTAAVLRASEPGRRQASITRFLAHCSRALTATDYSTVRDLEFTIHAISVFLKRRALRVAFQEAGLVPHVPRLLTYLITRDASAVQLTYEALLCVWILSFDPVSLVDLHRAKLIPIVHKMLQRAVKEKCIRVGAMVLSNFVAAQQKYVALAKGSDWVQADFSQLGAINGGRGPSFFADMIGAGVLKTLWQLGRKKFGDEDITEAVQALAQVLESSVDDLTSFSEYRAEVESGVLEWSPVHTSVKFWKENHKQFEANQYEVLRTLAALLGSSNDLTTAVACYDIGELVRHHPSGRLLLSLPQLSSVKTTVMRLMSHPNPEVSRNALVAVQKMLVQKWDFIAS